MHANFGQAIATASKINSSAGIYVDDGVGTSETLRRSSSNDLGQSIRLQSGFNLLSADSLTGDYVSDGFHVFGDLGGVPTNGPRIAGLAVRCGDNVDVHIDTTESTPLVTGVENKTAPGHRSGFLWIPQSANTTANQFITAGAASLGVTDFRSARCMNLTAQNNVGTSNTSCRMSASPILLWNHNHASKLYEASIDDQASGFDIDWTTVWTNSRRFSWISVEEVPITVSPSSIPSGEAWGTPSVEATVDVEPSAIASEEAFGTPTLQPGVATVSPTAIASAEALGTPAVQAGAVQLSPSSIPSAEAWGSPTLQPGVATVSPSSIASEEAFGTPAVQAGAVQLSPTAIASEEAFGTPALQAGAVQVSPTSIGSEEAFGTPAVQPGLVQITPTAIASAEAWGTPALQAGAVVVSPASIASGEAFGVPSVEPQPVAVQPASVASAEAWGTPLVNAVGAPTILPPSIASAEAWGTPIVTAGATAVAPSSVPSGEAWGTPALQATVDILVASVASAEAWGTPELVSLLQIISPAGIATGEVWGVPQLLIPGEARDVFPSGIPSGEEWGLPFLIGGVIPVTLKKAIYDALIAAAKAGTFVEADYDSATCTLTQGLQVQPQSIEANETNSVYRTEGRHGRAVVQDRAQWGWLLILRFNEEVITELFEESLADNPICIERSVTGGRQVRMKFLDATYTHPPRVGASNGTEAKFRFTAELSHK